ncbi:MAG: hypothetical protein ACFFDN_04795 [Candidatus Hodarchaeota archaeon]
MKKIKCKICGREVQIERLNVSFYTKWIEIEPGIWVCRKCEQSTIWPNIIQYKLPDEYRS